MNYHIEAHSVSNNDAKLHIKNADVEFGTTTKTDKVLPNPAELFLGAFAACMLKNVERFSDLMDYSYSKALLKVSASRLENPPRMDEITYELIIYSNDKKLNTRLLKKNIEKHGTIYNTIKLSCTISGTIAKLDYV